MSELRKLILPLQLKEHNTPTYLINTKSSGKQIDGNFTSSIPSFIIQFDFLEWWRTLETLLITGKDLMKLIELVQSNNMPGSSKPEETRGKLVMAPAYSQQQPYSGTRVLR